MSTRTTRSRSTRSTATKDPEDLVPELEIMAENAGVKLPKDEKARKQALRAALENSQIRRGEYSKQEALKKLKETFGVDKPKGKGDPFTLVELKPPSSRRGINAPPPEEERKKPPAQRRTASGKPSARMFVANEENRPLADALYELAEFTLHGDNVQKGISYLKAAKSVRLAPHPIRSKEDALKLVGVGKSTAEKIDEFLKTGKIQVLEEYRRGERGL